ncbi:MAG: LysE family transporter [Bacillota bacterium]|jgi:threonine/homoserine/homoserine lactone efflux protein
MALGTMGLMVTAFVIGLSGAMAPGSLLVVVITETMKHGFWAGPLAVAGHALIEMIVVVLLSLGLGTFLSHDSVLGVIGLLGGLTLFFFGYATLRTAKTQTLSLDSADSQHAVASSGRQRYGGLLRTAMAGIAASVSNPYWIVWWATIGATYVATGAKTSRLGPITFYVGHIAADLVWYTLVSWAIATGRRFINDRLYQAILYVCAVFIFVFGAYFLRLGFLFVVS